MDCDCDCDCDCACDCDDRSRTPDTVGTTPNVRRGTPWGRGRRDGRRWRRRPGPSRCGGSTAEDEVGTTPNTWARLGPCCSTRRAVALSAVVVRTRRFFLLRRGDSPTTRRWRSAPPPLPDGTRSREEASWCGVCGRGLRGAGCADGTGAAAVAVRSASLALAYAVYRRCATGSAVMSARPGFDPLCSALNAASHAFTWPRSACRDPAADIVRRNDVTGLAAGFAPLQHEYICKLPHYHL